MAITGFFGVPRVGKSTILTQYAKKEQWRKKRRYNNIYTINIEIDGCKPIPWEYLKTYCPDGDLILIDEITLNADNREWKSFPQEIRDFFILHGHTHCDIIYVTQNFEKVDAVIRGLTYDLWYMEKSPFPFFRRFTKAKRIYRKITINEQTSELKMGYRFGTFIEGLFIGNKKICYRPRYYQYYDSWALLSLADRPKMPYIENTKRHKKRKVFKLWKMIKKIKT